MQPARPLLQVYSLLTLAVLALAILCVAVGSPAAPSDSVLLQKILFIHLPAAATTFVACGVVFVASLGHLFQHRRWWDDLAQGAGIVAVAACSTLLATGMIWGKQAWGGWWTWSPRLTFSLILWVLYVGYLVLRPLVSPERRAAVGSVYGIVAFLDVPLVYMSVKILPDVHPSSVPMDVSMKRTLLLCTLAAIMSAGWVIAWRLSTRRGSGDRAAAVPAPGGRLHHASTVA